MGIAPGIGRQYAETILLDYLHLSPLPLLIPQSVPSSFTKRSLIILTVGTAIGLFVDVCKFHVSPHSFLTESTWY